MTKILLWIGIVIVLLLALRLLNVAKAKRRVDASRGTASPPTAETMIRCTRCGVYLPQKDATPGPSGPTCGDPACVQRQ